MEIKIPQIIGSRNSALIADANFNPKQTIINATVIHFPILRMLYFKFIISTIRIIIIKLPI